MPQTTKRSNGDLAKWLRAAAVAALSWAGMWAMHAFPTALPVAWGLIAGGIALANAEIGVLIALGGLCLPILAVNPIVGIVVVIVLLSAEHYLGGGSAEPFLLYGLAFVGAFFGPVWAAAAIAGLLFGATEGALTAIGSCLAIEALGVLTARPGIGSVFTGGPFTYGAPKVAALAFAQGPSTLLSTDWIAESFKLFSSSTVDTLFGALGHIGNPVALLVQAAVWALGAAVTGVIVRRAGRASAVWVPIVAVAAGVGVMWAGDGVMRIGMGLPLSAATSALALGSSLAVAVVWALARETVFGVIPAAPAAAPAARPITMAAEDADVDELLHLIATAEDKLASQHTSQRVVLITDMKSFSRMTEEDGSVASAKAIQRHRDILVPVISANKGCGKSTGGDGVVAAFESASDAIKAAVEGQRALAENNAARSNEREIWVRMGLASGEVVLDNGGRPFIGAGLNLAARVMNLADGGQIFSTGDVASAAEEAGATAHSFGAFELKNIASAVQISEILWADGQQPADPHGAEHPAD